MVTTTSSALGSSWATEIAMSPVPGASQARGRPARPTIRQTGTVPGRCSRGPRHRIARSAPANMPMEISFAPRGDRHEHAIQIGGLCMHAEQARQ